MCRGSTQWRNQQISGVGADAGSIKQGGMDVCGEECVAPVAADRTRFACFDSIAGRDRTGVNDNRCAQAREVDACAWRKGGVAVPNSWRWEGARRWRRRGQSSVTQSSSRFDGHGSSTILRALACPALPLPFSGAWLLRLRSRGPFRKSEFPVNSFGK
jgi:hypothetical protein